MTEAIPELISIVVRCSNYRLINVEKMLQNTNPECHLQ